MSRIRSFGPLLAVIMLLPAPGATAAAPTVITATAAGSRIPLSQVGSLHCHDLELPVIRCFRTGPQMERAMARSLERRRRRAGGASIQATSFVRVYEHNNFDGASMALSSSYSDLGAIGWNDRISSYRVLNLGVGAFYQHTNGLGTTSSFCCSIETNSLGARNDTFSSVSGSA